MENIFIFSYIDEDKNGIFKDITSNEGKKVFKFVPSHRHFSSHILQRVEQISLSYKLNRYFTIPFQTLFYQLGNYTFDKHAQYYIILPSTSISKMSVKYLIKLKEKHRNIRLFALLTDSMNASSPHMNLVREKLKSSVWDLVLTYDKYDAEQYGFTWFGYTYYSAFDDVEPSSRVSDLYYIGYNKGGRKRLIEQIYEMLFKRINCNFHVISHNRGDLSSERHLQYEQRHFTYPEVIKDVKSTNCILEVLQKNQEAQSIRYFEAVVYGKKLLTNNKHIFDLPYYNPNYMKYFERLEDIDVDWIRNRETIDYHYKGEFSPIYIADFIKEYYGIKE